MLTRSVYHMTILASQILSQRPERAQKICTSHVSTVKFQAGAEPGEGKPHRMHGKHGAICTFVLVYTALIKGQPPPDLSAGYSHIYGAGDHLL